MQCDNCNEREAAIHLTQIVDNSVTTLHLCAQCAAEKGVQTGANVAKFPLSDFLASMGKGVGEGLTGGSIYIGGSVRGLSRDLREVKMGAKDISRLETYFKHYDIDADPKEFRHFMKK